MNIEAIRTSLEFFSKVPSYLRKPLTVEQSKQILRQRFECRTQTFLDIARRAIYQNPASAHAKLLQWAGCEYGDLEKLVAHNGVEGALATLLAKGVYLTVDEYKGLKTVKRGSASMDVNLHDLRNPLAAHHIAGRSSGSRSRGTPVLFDLKFIRGCAVNCSLFFDARGGSAWKKADWEVYGAGARFRLLKFAGFGEPPVRSFSQLPMDSSGIHPLSPRAERGLRWACRLGGVSMPKPIHAPTNDPVIIAKWMREELDRGDEPHLLTVSSSAVGLSKAAQDAGIDLTGAHLTLGGEPITRRRLDLIEASGLEARARYGSIECGPVGYGCLNPDAADDVHLLHDLHALVQAEDQGDKIGVPREALFISSLHPSSPFVFLNVSMGDQARRSERSCGCPMEQLGWGSHLSGIGSFEKLTAGGMTLPDDFVVRVLEETLPDRFGGTATDYQLVEEDTADGEPEIRLLVHPRVGAIDVELLRRVFFDAIVAERIVFRQAEAYWRETNTFKVVRREPYRTASAKILHLHSNRVR